MGKLVEYWVLNMSPLQMYNVIFSLSSKIQYGRYSSHFELLSKFCPDFSETKHDRDMRISLLASAYLVYVPILNWENYDIQNGHYDVNHRRYVLPLSKMVRSWGNLICIRPEPVGGGRGRVVPPPPPPPNVPIFLFKFKRYMKVLYKWFYATFNLVKKIPDGPMMPIVSFSKWSDLHDMLHVWSWCSRFTNSFWIIFPFIENPVWPSWQPFWIFFYLNLVRTTTLSGTKSDRAITIAWLWITFDTCHFTIFKMAAVRYLLGLPRK